MRIGIITGSGTYALPELSAAAPEPVETEWGTTEVSRGTFAGVDVVHVSRHGEGHPRLSNHVTHRANIDALRQAGCDAVLAVTVCGAVDPSVALGSLIVFDDLHFVSNRLPDGSLCTFHDTPGDVRRGHWIYEDPYAPELRRALLAGAAAPGSTRATAAATATSTARASTRRPRSAGSPPAGSPPSPRPPGRRPCCAGRRTCRSRWSATPPTTPTGCRTRPRRSSG